MTDAALAVLDTATVELGAKRYEPHLFDLDHPPRYLHATVKLGEERLPFRLKVVNPARADREQIRNCCRNANRVHAGLIETDLGASFRVPGLHAVPDARVADWYVAAEIEGVEVLSLENGTTRADLVARLVNMEVATRGFDEPSGAKPTWIESCPRQGYRDDHVGRSLREMRDRGEVTARECDQVLSYFDRTWSPSAELHAGRCLVHGDCSTGNVLGTGADRWLIDFEHAHIGAPGLDLAHLWVNLMMKEAASDADALLAEYVAERSRRGLSALPGPFSALAVERIVGKLNSMKRDERSRTQRATALLRDVLGGRLSA